MESVSILVHIFEYILVNFKFSDQNDKTFKYLKLANDRGNWISRLYNKFAVPAAMICLVSFVIVSLSMSFYKEGRIDEHYFIYSIRLR